MRPEEMQHLARGMSFAETVFVVPPKDPGAQFGLRCFTPTTEASFSGHGLLGAAYVLATTGRLTIEGDKTEVYAEVGGSLHPVTLQHPAGSVQKVSMVEQEARFGERLEDFGRVAAALSLDPMDILRTSLPVQVVATGLACLIVPVASLVAMRAILPMGQAVDELLQDLEATCLLAFTEDTLSPQNDVHVRVFAPPLGIDEDPATGSANGALAAYLVRHGVVIARPTVRLRSEQGTEIGRPSVIELQVDTSTSPPTILVGGRVARSIEGSVFY
jgi:trans-2,3-dihydro-3-hydroxyanthranilate isomerase